MMDVFNEMCMALSASKCLGNSDKEITRSIITGFSGQLRGWWDHFLTEKERTDLLATVKPEIIEGQVLPVENAFSTLIFSLTKHFVGSPTGIAESDKTETCTWNKTNEETPQRNILVQRIGTTTLKDLFK